MGRQKKELPAAPVGARRQWAADRALRAAMRSPGRRVPSLHGRFERVADESPLFVYRLLHMIVSDSPD